MPGPTASQTPTAPPGRALFVFLTAISVLSFTARLPALPDIVDTFGVDFAPVNLSIVGCAVATVLAEAISAALLAGKGPRGGARAAAKE
ncbi:hypothetical protein [Nocardiopsis valliformis]|uniref:hypothetical protein n=1 Tax=Nocardiopsis valliformis TaxID=239974 RepID=UPI001268F310|nr:hypothetical protein [Nocardiopsis valliformis]